MGGPILPASGSVTRLGTKKTGNHLASNAAPGLKSEKIVDPKGKRSILAKRAQHPPNEEGKLMDKAWKSFRKPTSKAIKSAVEIKESVSVGALWLPFDDDDEEEEEAPLTDAASCVIAVVLLLVLEEVAVAGNDDGRSRPEEDGRWYPTD